METVPSVLIDARMVEEKSHGIATYIQQIAKGLDPKETQSFLPIFLTSSKLPKHSPLRAFKCHTTNIPFLSPLEPLLLPREIKKIDHSLYVSPSFSSLAFYPKPHAQILHDLNHLIFGGLAKKLYYRTLVLHSLRTATSIAGVSLFSQNTLKSWLQLHGMSPDIELIPNVVQKADLREELIAPTLAKYQIEPKNYFFTLGNPKPHKNMLWLEDTYKSALSENDLPKLVTNQSGEVHPKIIRIPQLSEEEKNILYANCTQFLYPAIYDGFGLPPIEAYLLNSPIAVNKIDIFQENIGRKAGVYFLRKNSKEEWSDLLRNYKNLQPPLQEEQKKLLDKYSLANQSQAFRSFVTNAIAKSSLIAN